MMTDKEQIKCNYKFQDKERFDGRPYCTCFDRLCEDLFFVYEDLKQLARKTQECDRCRRALEEIEKVLSHCIMTGAIVKILTIINEAKEEECN